MKIKTLYLAAFMLLGVFVFFSPGFAQTRVLFVSANPISATPALVEEEMRNIGIKTRMADYRNALDKIYAPAARPDDLLQALLQYRPVIVHFSGHGSPEGIALIDDKDWTAKLVKTEALKELFTTLKGNIRVVVLNSCYSQPQAEAIAEVIDCVIGMEQGFTPEAAIIYAGSFYRAIGFNLSVQVAHALGKLALALEEVKDKDGRLQWEIPKLKCRPGVNPAEVYPLTTGAPIVTTASDLQLDEVRTWRRNQELVIEVCARNPHEQVAQLLELQLSFFSEKEPKEGLRNLKQKLLNYTTVNQVNQVCSNIFHMYDTNIKVGQNYAEMKIPLRSDIAGGQTDRRTFLLDANQLPQENYRQVEAVIRYNGDRLTAPRSADLPFKSATGQTQEIKPDSRIARSTIISLANPESKKPIEKVAAYLPAGTRVLVYDIKRIVSGYDSRLILTESGLWGYIAVSSLFKPEEYIQSDSVIIQRPYKLDKEAYIQKEKFLQPPLWLSYSEIHELVNENEPDDKIRIRLSPVKVKGTKLAKNPPEVKIPKNYATIMKKKEICLYENLPYYTKSIIDDILEKIVDYGTANVSCDYYTNTKKGNQIYTIKKINNRSRNMVSYSIINPENTEYVFDRDINNEGLPFAQSGRLTISTYKDYFTIKDVLANREFPEDEIDFIISQCARCTIR
jgi:hypothetical protein